MTKSRDNYFRCRFCKRIWDQSDLDRNSRNGTYICPYECKEPFEQPPYEKPNI